MSVRGSSHAMANKKVINHDRGGTFVMCAWMDCYKDGFENNKVVQHEHARTVPCESDLAKHISYVFCTERHRQYWLASTGQQALELEARYGGRVAGMLPPGMRQMIG